MFGMFKKGSEAESDGYDPDQVTVHYEGEFEAGQYQGKGTLIDRHGEVHEGEFKANLFVG